MHIGKDYHNRPSSTQWKNATKLGLAHTPCTQLFSVLRPGIKFPNPKLTTETDGWSVSQFDCCITVRHILMIQTSE